MLDAASDCSHHERLSSQAYSSGALVALPVHVSGTVQSPVIVSLDPKAVASRMVDIMSNILKLPADLISTTHPSARAPTPEASGK